MGDSGDNGTLGDCTGMYGLTAMRDIVGTMGHWETALVYGRTAMRDIVGTMGHWETALVCMGVLQ